MVEQRLLDRLRAVDDPEFGEDIVSLGLVTDVQIDGDVAVVTLAFNAPLSPIEWLLCDEIRALCRGVGLEPRIRAETDDEQGVFPRVKNTIAIGATNPDAGGTLVTANLAASLASLGARVGVLDCRLQANEATWLDTIDPPDLSAEPIAPTTVQNCSVIRLGSAITADDSPPAGATVLELVLPTVLEAFEWGSVDYLLVALPPGTSRVPETVLRHVPIDGTIAVAPVEADPALVQTTVQEFETLETTVLGVVGTADSLDGALESDREDAWRSDQFELGGPFLDIVPSDRSVLATAADAPSSIVPPSARVTVDDCAPFRELAIAVADRIGAVNRQSVVNR